MALGRSGWVLVLLATIGLCGWLSAAEQETPPPKPDTAAPAPAPAPAATPAPTEAAAPAPTETPPLTYSRGGADTCLGCHDDEVALAIFKGPHGNSGRPAFAFRARSAPMRSLSWARRPARSQAAARTKAYVGRAIRVCVRHAGRNAERYVRCLSPEGDRHGLARERTCGQRSCVQQLSSQSHGT